MVAGLGGALGAVGGRSVARREPHPAARVWVIRGVCARPVWLVL